VACWYQLSASLGRSQDEGTHVHLDPGETLGFADLGLLENVRRAVTTCDVLEVLGFFVLESLTDPAVHRAVLADLAAEKLPDRHTEDLALDIPEGDVDTEPCERGRRVIPTRAGLTR
jgi:hypothetical protein